MKKFILFLLLSFLCTSVNIADAQHFAWRFREHATDCTSITDGRARDLCHEEDSNRLFKCEPTGADIICDSAAEWVLTSESPKMRFTLFNPNALYDVDTQFLIWSDVDSNITIIRIYVTCDGSSNEIAGDIKHATAFIGLGSATVINDFDTTSGVREDTSITSASVSAGLDIYGEFDSQPNAAITQCGFTIEYTYD